MESLIVFLPQERLVWWQNLKPSFAHEIRNCPPSEVSIRYLDASMDCPIFHTPEGLEFCIDFDKDHINYQRKNLRGKNEPLARAFTGNRNYKRVHDLSLGLAIDALTAIQLGFEVSGNERSPLIALMIKAAIQATNTANYKFTFFESNAETLLSDSLFLEKIEVLYFDPMYPHKKKSALPKKEMQIFRDLVGDDMDAESVLEYALKTQVPRIVVKRPVTAEFLLTKPSYSVETKVVRWDIYQR
ncbi:MAG: class I SAM-dependent methyltransferase [Bdellovibrionia bacterium]